MEIITKFLEAMQVLLVAKVALLLIAGLGFATAGLLKRKRWLVAVGLVVAFGQFAWPWLSNKGYERQIDARREYVHNLPKAPIPADYPRRLVLDGEIPFNTPGWFIAAGYVDEIDMGGLRLVATQGVAHCREAALALANPDPTAPETNFSGNAFQWIKKCTSIAGPATKTGDAIVLRINNRTTLYDRENARHNGAPRAIQVSLRQNGKEVLAHYDEMPILSYPKSATKLLPEGYDYPCSEFAHAQIVANLLDAAMHPERARALLQRSAVRRSKYDACIASIAPLRAEDAQD